MVASPVILDAEGESLTLAEKRLIAQYKPAGFILFQRNCVNPEQVKALINQFKEYCGHEHPLILIDQEGGRVQRMKPPHWQAWPNAASFRENRNMDTASAEIYKNACAMGEELAAVGINVNCAPVVDVPVPGAHDVIGNRAYSTHPKEVAVLAGACAKGLNDAGVMPMIKHIPGHGRATADSHLALPVVDTPREELEHTDFIPFKMLNQLPAAMTAHVKYTALDSDLPATLSPTVIRYIREEIGFKGLLFSDALDMQALQGERGALCKQALSAGCDLVLICNSPLDMREQVCKAADRTRDGFEERVQAALAKPVVMA